METIRIAYRNPIVETILIFAVMVQISTGVISIFRLRGKVKSSFERIRIWTGFYLALFFFIHLSAVFMGRIVQNVDTNFYFGAAGLNTFPHLLFFFPYYTFALLSFFGHIAATHAVKMKYSVFGITPKQQALMIIILGAVITFTIIFGLTAGFTGMELPKEYVL